MNIAFETVGGTAARPNEDWVAATPDAVVVLDGVTAPPEVESGCHHGVPWFVRQLGTHLIACLDNPGPVADALAQSIDNVGHLHAGMCDLKAPGSPAAAVALLRIRDGHAGLLVLADTSIVLDTKDGIVFVTDRRVESAAPEALARTREDPIGSPEHQMKVAQMSVAQLERRNTSGGYWVAAADPAAAEHAITKTLPIDKVERAALFSDGASRLVDTFDEVDWTECLNHLEKYGPRSLIAYVRRLEESDPNGQKWPRFKKSDDATVAIARI